MPDENLGAPVGPPPAPAPVVLKAGTYVINTESTLVEGGVTVAFASGTLVVS